MDIYKQYLLKVTKIKILIVFLALISKIWKKRYEDLEENEDSKSLKKIYTYFSKKFNSFLPSLDFYIKIEELNKQDNYNFIANLDQILSRIIENSIEPELYKIQDENLPSFFKNLYRSLQDDIFWFASILFDNITEIIEDKNPLNLILFINLIFSRNCDYDKLIQDIFVKISDSQDIISNIRESFIRIVSNPKQGMSIPFSKIVELLKNPKFVELLNRFNNAFTKDWIINGVYEHLKNIDRETIDEYRSKFDSENFDKELLEILDRYLKRSLENFMEKRSEIKDNEYLNKLGAFDKEIRNEIKYTLKNVLELIISIERTRGSKIKQIKSIINNHLLELIFMFNSILSFYIPIPNVTEISINIKNNEHQYNKSEIDFFLIGFYYKDGKLVPFFMLIEFTRTEEQDYINKKIEHYKNISKEILEILNQEAQINASLVLLCKKDKSSIDLIKNLKYCYSASYEHVFTNSNLITFINEICRKNNP